MEAAMKGVLERGVLEISKTIANCWPEYLKSTCWRVIFSKVAGFLSAALLENEFLRGCFFKGFCPYF